VHKAAADDGPGAALLPSPVTVVVAGRLKWLNNASSCDFTKMSSSFLRFFLVPPESPFEP